jgi:hypothetical protein
MFGESTLVLQQQLLTLAPDNAAEVWKRFVTDRSKFPPKLADKYSTISCVLVTYPDDNGVWKISVQGNGRILGRQAPPFNVPGGLNDVRITWQVFRDICESKFDKPIISQNFPIPASLSGSANVIPTDIWDFDGIEVSLSISRDANRFIAAIDAIDVLRQATNEANSARLPLNLNSNDPKR